MTHYNKSTISTNEAILASEESSTIYGIKMNLVKKTDANNVSSAHESTRALLSDAHTYNYTETYEIYKIKTAELAEVELPSSKNPNYAKLLNTKINFLEQVSYFILETKPLIDQEFKDNIFRIFGNLNNRGITAMLSLEKSLEHYLRPPAFFKKLWRKIFAIRKRL
jgi:hypothetical protein